MKLFLAVVMTLSSFSAFAQKTYKSYPELTRLIEEMRESASGGPSLSFFDFNDGMPEDSSQLLKCDARSMSTEEITQEFSELANSMYRDGAPTMNEAQFKELKEAGLSEFRLLIGQGPFKACSASTSGFMAAGEVNVRIGMEYTFMTEVSSED